MGSYTEYKINVHSFLCLLQYPIRPADITYDNIPHMGARKKPEQQKVTLCSESIIMSRHKADVH